MPSLNEIRTAFLDYFRKNGHEIVASSTLVPRNDPSLMFTNSGMVQFKNIFTGLEKRSYSRAATSQKCVRAGGKHNDLDNVGYTARHHTFFEMLGNFSFGDYFKEAAIPFAWDLITKEYGIPAERLLATVYHDDHEAAEIWKKYAGLSDDRIIRIPTADNFWSMGATGPCGPCTEIFYDHGENVDGGPPGSDDEDGDRFVEIWNLVFMQFEQFEDGSRQLLPKPSIDTGMGLERVGALLQGKHDNYDTDLLRALIIASAHATSTDPDGAGRIHHRVIADHLRSAAFLIAEGVMPSKDGRGYVLRRIMRRAMRHAHLLGTTEPCMHLLVSELVRQMGQAFPELSRAESLIRETLLAEESRFKSMLGRGLSLLENELAKLPDGAELPGATAFKLYDTYGFPLDLTQDALRERGKAVDSRGFEEAMKLQREKARAAWVGTGAATSEAIWFDIEDKFGATEFLGFETEVAEGMLQAIIADGEIVSTISAKRNATAVFNQTPFYGEAGGQVGDTGLIESATGKASVLDTKRRGELTVHAIEIVEGSFQTGQSARLEVDGARRSKIRSNHSATHLLHESLRRRLGEHVSQSGSLNDENRLRFDFTHTRAMSLDEIEQVEREVNEFISGNFPVETRIMAPSDAQKLGAQALFGEKYGDEVRVVSMGRVENSGKGTGGTVYSMELCGGTHVSRTGEIGLFVTTGEAASAAGVRRIEALTGEAARSYLRLQDIRLAEVALLLKSPAKEVAHRVKSLLDERKALMQEIETLRKDLALRGRDSGKQIQEPLDINGIRFLGSVIEGVPGKQLPPLIDEQKRRLGSGTVLLISVTNGSAAVAAGVTDDLTSRLSAVDLVRAVVGQVGGKGGGGRRDFARGGGNRPENANAAVEAAKNYIGGLE
ncbi:MAG: alanine--tRNA ligase [Albidovulum sp.]|nr:alanine--tRNA ligase [Albidovulum sp.]